MKHPSTILKLALILTVVMAMLLAGCNPATTTAGTTTGTTAGTTGGTTAGTTEGTTAGSETSGSQEVIDITVSLWDIELSFPEGEPDAIAKMIQDKFGVKFTPVNVGWGDADEKYNTWAASGQLPDIIGAIAHVGQARYFQWINDGVVRALPADTSKYPIINTLLQQDEVTAFQIEGQNYFLPRQTYADSSWWAMDRGLVVRKDWLANLNMAEPTTEQEYIDMCAAFAKNDPDGDGQNNTVGFVPVAPWILTSQGWPGYGYTDGRWVQEADGKFYPAIASERTLRMMQFFKKMYQAGGMDPDFATLESAAALEKFASGKAGMLGRQVSPKHTKAILDKWVELQPDKDFTDSISILHGPTLDGKYTRFTEMAYWSETYIEAKVDDAKLDRILQLYDYLYSDEGMKLMSFGIEGTDWTMDGDQVKLLTPIKEDTGLHTATNEIYPFVFAMGYLASWAGDLLQYVDPSIPEDIRALTTAERDARLATWVAPEVDWRVQSIDVMEKQEMAAITFGDDWVSFIMDTSGKSDEDLYTEMRANWDANGLQAASDAVTAVAQEKGYIG